MSLVGSLSPKFTAPAVINGKDLVESFSLEQFLGEKYVVFFFYPADFTFVCPTEILRFQELLAEFQKRNAVVIGCSTDSQYSHWKWLQTPKNEGGIQGVKFPLVADQTLTISSNYEVLAGTFGYDEQGASVFEGSPVAYRGTFIIDKEGVVRSEIVNDLGLGRSVDETLRTLDALIHYEKHGEVCPAEWHEGDVALKPTFEDIAKYLSEKK